MKITITSTFAPAIGGTERMARFMADGFTRAGHQVTVVTLTPGDPADDRTLPFAVMRRPAPARLLELMAATDAVLQFGTMLRTIWAALVTQAPVVISHQTWLERREGRLLAVEQLKRLITRRCRNIVPSRALAGEPAGPVCVIPNCFDDVCFHLLPGHDQQGELVFVGRLVADKGVDLLLQALGLLARRHITPRLTIVGDGPERSPLEALAASLGLGPRVKFVGSQSAPAVARLLNAHDILVVPSRWEEPFGIVALEGIACGCRLVAAAGGGLADLVGPFGTLCARNSVDTLASALRLELTAAARFRDAEPDRGPYLRTFTPASVVARYLEELERHVPVPRSVPVLAR